MSKNDLSESPSDEEPISDLRGLSGPLALQLKFRGYLVTLRPGTLFIGRSPHCELAISDPAVSRQHARLNVDAGRVAIEDLGSANGVFVNGVRIRGPQELRVGDKVQIGTHDFELVEVQDEHATQANRYRITADTHSGAEQSTLVDEVRMGSGARPQVLSRTPGLGVPLARTSSRQSGRAETGISQAAPIAPRISTAPGLPRTPTTPGLPPLSTAPAAGSAPSSRPPSSSPGSDSLAASVAALDELLTRGAFDQVEARLSPILMRIHELILEQHPSRFDLAEHVVGSTARLVAATKNPTWINYAVTLYALLQKPLPDVIIGQIHALTQAGITLNIAALRAYLATLDAHAAYFEPAELALLERLRLVINYLRA